MGFRNRKNNENRLAELDWLEWIAGHRDLVQLAGLPASITITEDCFVDFGQHGYVKHLDYKSEDLDDVEYAAYRDLMEAYFAAGRGCFSVIALQADDYVALNKKYWNY